MADQYDTYDPGDGPRDQYDDVPFFNKLKSSDLASLIADALIDAKIIKVKDFDKAVEIIKEEIIKEEINVRKAMGDY